MKNKQLSLKDKQILTNEWAMILSSGLPISEGLYILQDQVMNKDLKEVVESKGAPNTTMLDSSYSASHPIKVLTFLFINIL